MAVTSPLALRGGSCIGLHVCAVARVVRLTCPSEGQWAERNRGQRGVAEEQTRTPLISSHRHVCVQLPHHTGSCAAVIHPTTRSSNHSLQCDVDMPPAAFTLASASESIHIWDVQGQSTRGQPTSHADSRTGALARIISHSVCLSAPLLCECSDRSVLVGRQAFAVRVGAAGRAASSHQDNQIAHTDSQCTAVES